MLLKQNRILLFLKQDIAGMFEQVQIQNLQNFSTGALGSKGFPRPGWTALVAKLMQQSGE